MTKIILSGAARENQAGKIFLTDRGVSEEDILIDDGGLDTYSTIYRCTEAFPEKKFIVCTQQKYFKRTGYLISKLGMNIAWVLINTSIRKKSMKDSVISLHQIRHGSSVISQNQNQYIP